MRFVLGLLVVLFNLADNTTTFLCLRAPVDGFEVIEANPLARWLFESVGLVEGLVFEMLLTTAAIAFLVLTDRISARTRLALLVALILLPAWASFNNFLVMRAVGLPLSLI
jgi:hypothetical protein